MAANELPSDVELAGDCNCVDCVITRDPDPSGLRRGDRRLGGRAGRVHDGCLSRAPSAGSGTDTGRKQNDLHRIAVLAEESHQRGAASPLRTCLGPNRRARETASAELRPRFSSTPSSRRTRLAPSVWNTSPPVTGAGSGPAVSVSPGCTGSPGPGLGVPSGSAASGSSCCLQRPDREAFVAGGSRSIRPVTAVRRVKEWGWPLLRSGPPDPRHPGHAALSQPAVRPARRVAQARQSAAARPSRPRRRPGCGRYPVSPSARPVRRPVPLAGGTAACPC